MAKKPLKIAWFAPFPAYKGTSRKSAKTALVKTKMPLNPRKVDARLIRMRVADSGFRVIKLKDILDFYGISLRTQHYWKAHGYLPKPAFCLSARRGYAGLYLQYQGYYLMQALNTLYRENNNGRWQDNPELVEWLHERCESTAARFRLRLARVNQMDIHELLETLSIEEVAQIIDE